MFQSSLNTYLLEKLNLNTQGITFSGDYLFGVNDGKFIIEEQIPGTYRLEETQVVPMQIEDWRNTTQPYSRIDLQDVVAPITFSIRQTQLEDTLSAIEEFRVLLNGASATIDGLNVGFRIGQPSAPSSPLVTTGEHWIFIQVIVMLSAGDGLLYGNGIQFKIAKTGETLQEVITSKIDIITTAAQDTKVSDYEVSIRNGKQTQQIVVDVFYEDNVTICNEFLNWLWQSGLNQIYDVSIVYTDSITKSDSYIINSMNQHIEYGIPTGFNITFFKA